MQNNEGNLSKDWAAKQAQKRADDKFPTTWYQNYYLQQAILIMIGIGVTVYQLQVGWRNVPHWFIALGIGVFLIGWMADTLTTDHAFRHLPEYRKRED